jgi:hypothetical protein
MSKKVSEARSRLNFMETAKEFHMIDSRTLPVVVTAYGEPASQAELRKVLEQIDKFPTIPLSRAQRRLLQRFTVALPDYVNRPGFVEQVGGATGPGALRWVSDYDKHCGVVFDTKEASIW